MKEIIEKLKDRVEHRPHQMVFLDHKEAQTIATALEQLTVISLMYQNQIIDIDLALQDAELADTERNEMYAVKLKIESMVQDLSKVLG